MDRTTEMPIAGFVTTGNGGSVTTSGYPRSFLPFSADLLERQSASDVVAVDECAAARRAAGPPAFLPEAPTTGKETGLPDAFIESLVFKMLLAAGNITSRDLARATALPGRAVAEVLTRLKTTQMAQHTNSAAQGDFLYALTEAGRVRARLYMEDCAYAGPAPVTLESYIQSVNAQGLASVHPKREDLERAFGDLLIDEKMFRRLGPAINSGRGLFLYGFPGNGKTSIAERITDCFGDSVWVPHTILCSGEIITLFDPQSHKVDDATPISFHSLNVDPRWVKIRRPTIVVGGELTMEALDLCQNPHTRVTEASLQLKSNTGTLVIDDFGRQRISPVELLNRWIVPLEKRYDFLALASGRKVKVPFDQLIIFSTNLEPKALVDEAFLRRIPYKIEIVDPTEEEFRKLFEIMTPRLGVEIAPGAIDYLIETHYRTPARPFRCCQPRDLLMQVRNSAAYAGEAPLATPATFDAACENYFAVMQPSPGVTANERGIAIPFLAITMIALLGMAALGIDVGMLATTATEIQNAADVTALAGVRALAEGGDTTPEDDAMSLLQRSKARGTALGAANLSSLTTGNFTEGAGYVSNLPPFNAVESVVTFQHDGLLSGMVGMPTSVVTKKAVAALAGLGRGRPTLPVVVGACHFDPNCDEDNCMAFIQLHGSQHDNAAWTGFFDGHGASTIRGFVPAPCGGGNERPELTADGTQYLDLIEGGATSVLKAIECMFNDNDQTEHIIPIVACDASTHFNHPAAVVGFATIVIESVTTQGPAASKGIAIRSIRSIVTGGGGGGDFGTRVARLVQ